MRSAGIFRSRAPGFPRYKEFQDVPLGISHPLRIRMLGRLLAFCLSLGMAVLRSSVFNCRIDLATDQECQSGYVKPEHQNYYGTQ